MSIDYTNILSAEDWNSLVWYAYVLRQRLVEGEESVFWFTLNGRKHSFGVFADPETERRVGKPGVGVTFDADDKTVAISWTNDTRFSATSDGRIRIEGGKSMIGGEPGLTDRLRGLAAHARESLGKGLNDLWQEKQGRPAGIHGAMSDFTRAVLQGRIGRANEVRNDMTPVTKRHRPQINTQAPAFDFGDVTSGVKLTGEMVEQFALNEGDMLTLPYPECFFVFNAPRDYQVPERLVNLVHIHHLVTNPDGSISGRVFCRFESKGERAEWLEEFWTLHWFGGTRVPEARVYNLPGVAKFRKVFENMAVAAISRTALAAWLLNEPLAIKERENQEVRIPKVLTLGKKHRAIPPVCVIRYDHQRMERALASRMTGTGSPKSPHSRRGHVRRLRDGRTVWVRDCRIHGGQDAPRYYEVRRAAMEPSLVQHSESDDGHLA